MAFTEFCCLSGGSNLNAGTRTGSTTEPGTAADFTYASGTLVQSTGVFTLASGNPQTDGVAVGDFASVYADGASVTGAIARVTAVSSTTITVSTTAIAGALPADGTSNRTVKIGGAWAGPNGTSAFPFNVIKNTLTNVAGDTPRVNFKNNQTYSITAVMTHANTGPITFQGYTTTYGDGGKATIDGGTSGEAFVLLNINSVNDNFVLDLIFNHNGATGFAGLVTCTAAVRAYFGRCVFANWIGNAAGLGCTAAASQTLAIQCEAYGGVSGIGFSLIRSVVRCVSHDNGTGFNTCYDHVGCIADTNSGNGFGGNVAASYVNCDSYNNTLNGFSLAAGETYLANCNAVKNGAYGVNNSGTMPAYIESCGFGSGTKANTSGQTTGIVVATASVAYPSGLTPWVDPANGDFRINLAAAKDAGGGTFTQTASGYGGTVGYPDIGAAEAIGGGGGRGGISISLC